MKKHFPFFLHAIPLFTSCYFFPRLHLTISFLHLCPPDDQGLSDFHLANCLIGQQADWDEWKHDLSQAGVSNRELRVHWSALIKSSRKRILHAHSGTYLQVHWSAMIKPWEDKGEQWSGKQAPLGLFSSYSGRRRDREREEERKWGKWLTRPISTTQTFRVTVGRLAD